MKTKQEILKAMGDIPEEIYDTIVASFYQETTSRLLMVEQSLNNNDMKEIALAAHAIKGAAANLHLTPIYESAKALEMAAKIHHSEEVSRHLAQLKTLIPLPRII